ncbi:hypothetical protein P5E64_00215 [Clostridium perfringens]|uniref:hypothetical protein n=1 Tax=Clostridium perfringens TaxID=1502 RepID=UPI0018E4C5B1|nr:hypothetical protein [Clostridium perfringens]MBI6002165.1 hypothetical protein [Clostridium perfringens]MBI6064292.1 hypothetical protein [Clostridium perfringens]MBI6076930.1 hypothetical protein [Clostridium perfringens]MBI6104571.1 hypothetical protein [Clostridium perfringens]MDK0701847.1 hypothetical protein [Clostridium perfringens]
MKVYDKAKWHNNCENNELNVKAYFQNLMELLLKNNMLSEDGREILDIGIDNDFSLNSKLVNEKGNLFLGKNYDEILSSIDFNNKISIDNIDKFFKQ